MDLWPVLCSPVLFLKETTAKPTRCVPGSFPSNKSPQKWNQPILGRFSTSPHRSTPVASNFGEDGFPNRPATSASQGEETERRFAKRQGPIEKFGARLSTGFTQRDGYDEQSVKLILCWLVCGRFGGGGSGRWCDSNQKHGCCLLVNVELDFGKPDSQTRRNTSNNSKDGQDEEVTPLV